MELSDKKFARSLSNAEFPVPQLSDTVVSVETSTSRLDVVRQLVGLGKGHQLTYGITGILHRKDTRLLFNNTGVLVEVKDRFNLLNP